jgi:ABC-type antimicrobial peptide transport system permease subunit
LTLKAPLSIAIVLLGLALALGGGLLAGAAGGLRAARLRPAEAMRRVE